MSVYRWTAITSGTMTDASERRAFIARADVYGRPIRINWSDDGTDSGTSVFSSTEIPWVEVVAADVLNPQGWTNAAMWGNMLRPEYMVAMRPYAWQTEWDSSNSLWFTTVAQFQPGNPASWTDPKEGARAAAGALVSKRPIVAYALGTS